MDRIRFVLSLTVLCACGEFVHEKRSITEDAGASEKIVAMPKDAGATVANTSPLCLLLRPETEDRDLLPGEILIASQPSENCVTRGAFEITRGEPQDFFLYGEPGARYCVAVRRENGYLTLSHLHGDVEREGDRFTWCVESRSAEESAAAGEPEQMTVRSLTAKARFALEFPEHF